MNWTANFSIFQKVLDDLQFAENPSRSISGSFRPGAAGFTDWPRKTFMEILLDLNTAQQCCYIGNRTKTATADKPFYSGAALPPWWRHPMAGTYPEQCRSARCLSMAKRKPEPWMSISCCAGLHEVCVCAGQHVRRLTPAQARTRHRAIHRLYAQGEAMAAIGASYGISKQMVAKILRQPIERAGRDGRPKKDGVERYPCGAIKKHQNNKT